uniref:Uncharacterized protein n=1 Tax=Rhizophora mucronata TaxID=61149 RepID=A0A2P2N767_RHIMU
MMGVCRLEPTNNPRYLMPTRFQDLSA